MIRIENKELLKDPVFDSIFIVGIAFVAVTVGLVVSKNPGLFLTVLLLDLWLLGYHHVIATFTRLSFDISSLKENKNLLIYLPIIVALLATILILQFGIWSLATIYLYWQWYHYTRQSEGISKTYAGKATNNIGNTSFNKVVFYVVPLCGILHVSARVPETFLNMPIKVLPIPEWVLFSADLITILLFSIWFVSQLLVWRKGKLSWPYFLYVLSHHAVFFVAYIWLSNINFGWLAVNIWHNTQYILFVWLYNNRRFSGSIDSKHTLLSTLSQDKRIFLYLTFCLTISTGIYFLLEYFFVGSLGNYLEISMAASAMIIYQTINFHHYVVDSVIWKLRKKSVRSKFNLA